MTTAILYLLHNHFALYMFEGWTPLHSSIRNDHPDITKWLLEKGADQTLAMTTGWTATHEFALKAKGSSYSSMEKSLGGGSQNDPATKVGPKAW